MTKRMDFSRARAAYPHRFTMEHVPAWTRKPAPNGRYYAPQFRTDREWFENTKFPPESGHKTDCYQSGETWPLGQWLDQPYRRT